MRDGSASLAAKLVSAILTWGACGDDRARADAGSSGAASSGTETSSSTGEPDGCSRVHEGNSYVLEDTDLASLSDVGHVTGHVQITMGAREQADLWRTSRSSVASRRPTSG